MREGGRQSKALSRDWQAWIYGQWGGRGLRLGSGTAGTAVTIGDLAPTTAAAKGPCCRPHSV